MANLLKHAFDLVLASFMDGEFHPGIGRRFSGLFYFGGSGGPIFQYQSMSKFLDFWFFQDTFDFHEVCFMDMVCGVKAGLCNITVIGKQEQAFAIIVQTSDGK